jgi:hypothetical protein
MNALWPVIIAQASAASSPVSPTATPVSTATPTPTPNFEPVISAARSVGVPVWALVALVVLLVGAIVATGWAVSLKRRVDSPTKSQSAPTDAFRNRVALYVLNSAIWGLITLAVLLVLSSASNAREVFNALLPVFGTWVGTLLAFYFSRENFEAASKSVREMAQAVTGAEKLQSTPVKLVMIRPDRIETLPDPLLNKKDAEITLTELINHLQHGTKRDRLPIFKDNKKVGPAERVLHRSIVEKFIAQATLQQPPLKPIGELTLADLMADPQLGKVVLGSFALVKSDATLADAKNEMDKTSAALGRAGNCYDVFVTENGKPEETVIGWVTNDIINENAKV